MDEPATPDLTTALTPLEGGYSGETFLAEVGGERSVVRVYAGRGASRGDTAPEIDAALLRLVRGLLPVPTVLEVRRPDRAAGAPGLLVTDLLPGMRADQFLAAAPDPDLVRLLGEELGRLLATLAQMPTLRAGMFVDGDLTIAAMPPEAADLPAWVHAHLDEGPLREWEADSRAGLLDVAAQAQDVLDVGDRTCLVHSDFNPKNLLVDPSTGHVTGLLDWEFAHSGHPFSDLGNLLRFERDPLIAEPVLAGYTRLRGAGSAAALDLARAADLFALVDLAARRGTNPVADRAHDLLRAVARERDWHAEPPRG
jgi:aminoglycoside phosphotransferase (APT) family kinase protein